MKQLLQLIKPFREMRKIAALCLVMVMTLGAAWAQTEVVAYTLTPATGSNNSYAGNCDITIGGITWNLTGNSTVNPWRIGGKSLTEVDRTLYSKTAIADNVSKIEVTHGAASNITVNSWTLEVASDADFSNIVSTLTPTFADNATTTINRPEDADWSNCYYRFTYNVTVSGTSNKFLEFSEAKFYKVSDGTQPITYTVTFDAGDGTFEGNTDFPTTTNSKEAGTYTLPSAERSGYTFDGWLLTGNTEPLTGSYTVSGDVDFTAQYTEDTPLPDGTDVLNWVATGSPSNSYVDWTYTAPSGAVYVGQSAGDHQSIQLRSNNNNSGIVTTVSAGKVTNISVEWNSSTATGRTLNVYGKNSAYTAATDLYGDNAGTLIGTIVYGTSTELIITQDYEYIGLRSNSSAMYLNEIRITWESVTPAAVATPTFTPASGTEFGNEGLSVTISCETEGADVFYTLDGSTPDNTSTLYNGAINLTTTTTISAIAYDGTDYSNVATATYTYVDPNAPGTQNNPYTVAQARAAIDAGIGTQGVYATGIVSEIVTPYNSQFGNITYNISADGSTTADQLQAYRGKSYNGANFTSENDILVGATVVIFGTLKMHTDGTYEFEANNQLVSYIAPTVAVEAPTFSPVAGTYADAQTVAISCETTGADIYYTTDGTEPTNESTPYTEALTISTATTVKAIAYVGSESSLVTTATYHINSAENPYSVTEALAFPEYQYPANGIYVSGIVSTAPTQNPTSNGELTYYISVDGAATDQLEVYKGLGLNGAAFEAQGNIQVGDIVTVYGNVVIFGTSNPIKEFTQGNYLVAFEHPVVPVINASNITINYNATSGEISYSIENAVEGQNLTATTTADWISDLTVGEESITFTCTANEGTEDRTATITLSYQGAVDVAITVTQGHFVADYATLPFAFDGGKADIATTSGLTQEGLGSDYNSSPKMKFDGTGDWLILHFNEAPGMLTFDIKGNSFSGGTFTVQTSADGENYADLATYTELGATQNEEFALGADVRYIKWVYTEKVNGNVGLGNIVLDKPCGKIVLNEANNYTWTEDFETMAAGITELWTGVEPHCWPLLEQYSSASMNHIGEETDTLPQVFYYPEFDAADGNYTLRMKYRSLLAMPELDETVEMSRLHLSMYVRQPKGYYKLLVGVWDEATNVFDSLFVVDNQSTNMEKFECDFSRYEGNGRYIAFKNVGGSSSNPHCSNYLDSIKLTYNTAQACSIDIEDYNEGFEGYTTNPGASGVEPYCWEVIKEERSLSISTKPQIYAGFNTTEGGNYTLRMRNRCVYAMPEFAEGVDISTLTMSFQLRQPKAVYMLQVGVVDAEGNFEMVSEINNATTEMEPVLVDFTGHPGSRIAFRNVLNGRHYDYSYNYIDDISFTVNTAKVSASEGSDVDVERYLDNIAVYPNPTTGMLYIDAVDVQKVECYNQMGQLVGVYDNASELNISELSNGVYMLRITVPQGVTMRKVVKR